MKASSRPSKRVSVDSTQSSTLGNESSASLARRNPRSSLPSDHSKDTDTNNDPTDDVGIEQRLRIEVAEIKDRVSKITDEFEEYDEKSGIDKSGRSFYDASREMRNNLRDIIVNLDKTGMNSGQILRSLDETFEELRDKGNEMNSNSIEAELDSTNTGKSQQVHAATLKN
jgi:vacuolar-type H+-ATPase subunit I/STV1